MSRRDEPDVQAPRTTSAGPQPMTGPGEEPVVRALTEHPRRAGRFRLRLGTGEVLLVSVEALAAARVVRVGTVLSTDTLALLRHEARVGGLVDRALASLARARRTRRELARRLRRVEADAAVVEEALRRVEAMGVLNDARTAEAEALAALARGEGPGRVALRLRRKGIAGRQAGAALADAMSLHGYDEAVACRAAAAKRWRQLARLDSAVARRRMVAFLQRRGFAGVHIRAALAELAAPGTPGDAPE